MHWWSLLDIQPANAMFLYYSFGVVGLETFIISEGSKVINKILFGQEKFKISDDKVTVVKTNFSRAVSENLFDKSSKTCLTRKNRNSINLLCSIRL